VHNVLPQSVNAGATWQLNSRWMLALQGDWVGWKSAFRALPVALTNGTNPAINGLLNSTSLNDYVPLEWKDQYSVHAGFERKVSESLSFSGGFVHANNPVPGSTLSPLTAAIMTNQITTGFGYSHGRAHYAIAYAIDPTTRESVGQSALLSGEYSNSTVRAGIQTITASSSWRF
jgi:long-subunit fatty acid transport protein